MPRRKPEIEEAPSRGKLRRQQQDRDAALARLAQRLVAMSVQARRRLPLDDTLREEIALAAGIPNGTGLRRQIRRITQLLREGDAAAIERTLDPPPASRNAPPSEPADQWLERLLEEGDEALQALVDARPDADRGRVRQWLRSVAQAREAADKAVAEGGPRPPKDKTERTLRKYLKALLDGAGGPGA